MSEETGHSHGIAPNACPPDEQQTSTGQRDSASHAHVLGQLASSGRLFSGQLTSQEAARAVACLCGRRLPNTLQLLLDSADVGACDAAALLKACMRPLGFAHCMPAPPEEQCMPRSMPFYLQAAAGWERGRDILSAHLQAHGVDGSMLPSTVESESGSKRLEDLVTAVLAEGAERRREHVKCINAR